jgi:hypothetical protein
MSICVSIRLLLPMAGKCQWSRQMPMNGPGHAKKCEGTHMARYGHISLQGPRTMVAHSCHVTAQQLEEPAWWGPEPKTEHGGENDCLWALTGDK